MAGLLDRKLRVLSTGMAIILGVAFMAGSLILTDTIARTFDALFADVYAGTDAYVRPNPEKGPRAKADPPTRRRCSTRQRWPVCGPSTA